MPLTPHQRAIAKTLAANRSPDSHLAGGAALHFSPRSIRYSNDLDYFNDSIERVASAFEADRRALVTEGFEVVVDMSQPGFVRARVSRDDATTKVEWVHDTAWRFLPVVRDPDCGFRMHPVDVAVHKLLALAGRDEARDYVDVLEIDATILPLGALCWAAAGKDPGFTPLSLLELLKRRGRPRPEALARLQTTRVLDPVALKGTWLAALARAEAFIATRPADEFGCLDYDTRSEVFVQPSPADETGPEQPIRPHFGDVGGVMPRILESDEQG